MQERSLDEPVEILETNVRVLETLPDRVERVELQLVQLRDEMRREFSAIRGAGGEGLTLAALREDLGETTRILREEIRVGDEQTRRYMRVLHEDVIARLTLIQEGTPRKKR